MYSLHHHDLGTPASDSKQQVTVEIDGHSVTGSANGILFKTNGSTPSGSISMAAAT